MIDIQEDVEKLLCQTKHLVSIIIGNDTLLFYWSRIRLQEFDGLPEAGNWFRKFFISIQYPLSFP